MALRALSVITYARGQLEWLQNMCYVQMDKIRIFIFEIIFLRETFVVSNKWFAESWIK